MRIRLSIYLIFIFGLGYPALADKDAGREVFRSKCVGCHSFQCSRNGPKLAGLFGRTAGSVSDFKGYSKAMKNSGIVWDEEKLDAYLKDPVSVVSGNSMAGFGKIENAEDRKNLIDFIREPDNSLDICL